MVFGSVFPRTFQEKRTYQCSPHRDQPPDSPAGSAGIHPRIRSCPCPSGEDAAHRGLTDLSAGDSPPGPRKFNIDTICVSVNRLLIVGASSQGYPARKLQFQTVSRRRSLRNFHNAVRPSTRLLLLLAHNARASVRVLVHGEGFFDGLVNHLPGHRFARRVTERFRYRGRHFLDRVRRHNCG